MSWKYIETLDRKYGPKYPIGIKINSADFQRGAFTEEESLRVIQLLTEVGIDIIEVSGGTYERAAMMGNKQKVSTKKREAYFADFDCQGSQNNKGAITSYRRF